MTEQLDLESIKVRCEKLPQGPWESDWSDEEMQNYLATNHAPPNVVIAWFGNYDYTAEFCARARDDVPALIAEIGRLKSEHLTLWDEFCAMRDRNVGLQKSVNAWIAVADQLPESQVPVLVAGKLYMDMRRVSMIAYFVRRRTVEADSYCDETGDADYEEETDSRWTPEGWYECSQGFEFNPRFEGTVTHWQPLPALPEVQP